MEDGCLSASEILAWRETAPVLTRYAGGYIGISLIMGNTPKVGAGPATAERYETAG
jgi:hypothetical protein